MVRKLVADLKFTKFLFLLKLGPKSYAWVLPYKTLNFKTRENA